MDTKLFVRRQAGGMFTVLDKSATPGDIWYVGSTVTTGLDAVGYGRNPDSPFVTIDYAIGQATTTQGDVIIVLPGHAETLSTADITVDKANLSIIGLGKGTSKPTITFGATTSEINVTSASVLLKNLRLVSGVNNLVNFIDADATMLEVEDCDFVTSNALEAYGFVVLATTVDFFSFKRCTFIQPTDPAGTNGAASTGVFYCEDTEHIWIEDCYFVGNFETAILHNKTTAGKDAYLKNCTIRQSLADGLTVVVAANMEGAIINCTNQNVNATDVTAAKCWGTLGTQFWIGGNSYSGNDSAAGGQLMVNAGTATS